jgi:hypothetical protein
MQSSNGAAEVLALAPADLDVSVHEGLLVRVEGILDMSTSSQGVTVLLLPASRAVEEAVMPCDQAAQHRNLMGKIQSSVFEP